MKLTAKNRSRVGLAGTTNLQPTAVVQLIADVAGTVKGGRKSVLTTGITNFRAEVHVEQRQDDRLVLSINSAKRLVELCTFSASASGKADGAEVRVGGLDSYKTKQEKLFYFIPVGPKLILGYDPYKRFLEAIKKELQARDSGAQVQIDVLV